MRKFWQKYESYTVEQWLVKAIHENLDFSLSVKQIPSIYFVTNFRIKYEMEFLRLESMEPLGERIDTSHNLGRNIAKTSKNDIDHLSLLRKFEGAETSVSSMAQNSQQTLNPVEPDQMRKNIFAKGLSPFDQNQHINLIDNTIVEKLSPVSYDFEMTFDETFSHDNRPGEKLDIMFEQKISKRLVNFHAKPIDRTQFDNDLLSK